MQHFTLAAVKVLANKFLLRVMLTLRHLLDLHPTLLLIDTASSTVQVAILRREGDAAWDARAGDAGECLFSTVETVLERTGPSLATIDAFVFCEAPGSVLGIRTAAVALRTWNCLKPRPVFTYCGLSLVAQALGLEPGNRNFSVIADARRDTWHHVDVAADGSLSSMKRLPTAALKGTIYMPGGFRSWTTPPHGTITTSYQLEHLLATLKDTPLFNMAAEPDAFLHEEPVYQTWTPQIHRAPDNQS